MRILLPALLAVPLALGAAAVRADTPPKLDVASTCRSSGSANPDRDTAASGCLQSENEAQKTLQKRWGEFGPAAKNQCSQQSRAGGFPSYVELLTCLELATGNVQLQSGRDADATGSVNRRGKQTDMPSTDADDDTRIDPKKVLGKPTGG